MSWVLAVDFGTSNTSAAHRIGPDRVESLPLTHTSNLMSSSVFIDRANAISTGDVAVNQASVDPAGFVVAPKAHVSDRSVLVRGQEVPVAAMMAAVLRTVYGQSLQRHNNHPPAEVVLTHPEAWSERELSVLREAASIAGLGGNVSLISEPRAAAFYYSRQHDAKIVKGSTIAVFDFGGGTLDVAVLTATNEWTFEVLRAGGDNALGGKNLDATISRWVDRQLSDEDPDLAAWLRRPEGLDARRNLDDQIRRAKELLSQAPSATIRVTGNGADMTFTLTRDEFEQLIEPQITRGVQLAASVLRDAGVDRGGLQALYLTGGSSRIPYVHRRLAELGPIATLDDPKTVVAKGAAGFVAGGRDTEPPANQETVALARDHGFGPRHAAPAVRPQPVHAVFADVPAPDAAPRRTRTPLLVGAGVLTAVAVAAGGAYAFTQNGGTSPAAAGTVETTTVLAVEGGLPPATSDSTYISESTDDVTSILPAKLITSSTSCEKGDFTMQGALRINCDIDPDSSLGKAVGVGENDYLTVSAYRDDQYARSTLIRMRDQPISGYISLLSEDGNRVIEYQPSDPYTSFFNGIDKSKGLVISFSVAPADKGLALMRELGFPSS
ncbi:Hsp70 family protein [Rhodococcus zopfii]|uniref:Hsp70 family protein n=1 Tax=Rhodococcus zopfii TaxID=43772 RepID=UPI000933C793|nr:Hsp70 family protein [Rhodococcus zopfii]